MSSLFRPLVNSEEAEISCHICSKEPEEFEPIYVIIRMIPYSQGGDDL